MDSQNQTYVTVQTLRDFGLTVDDATVDALLQHLNDTIEERIGAEIVEALDDDELKEMLAIQDADDDDKLGEWIAAHVPDYEQIVQDNIDITVGELAESTNTINDAA